MTGTFSVQAGKRSNTLLDRNGLFIYFLCPSSLLSHILLSKYNTETHIQLVSRFFIEMAFFVSHVPMVMLCFVPDPRTLHTFHVTARNVSVLSRGPSTLSFWVPRERETRKENNHTPGELGSKKYEYLICYARQIRVKIGRVLHATTTKTFRACVSQ